jgi:hypothetical protein
LGAFLVQKLFNNYSCKKKDLLSIVLLFGLNLYTAEEIRVSQVRLIKRIPPRRWSIQSLSRKSLRIGRQPKLILYFTDLTACLIQPNGPMYGCPLILQSPPAVILCSIYTKILAKT